MENKSSYSDKEENDALRIALDIKDNSRAATPQNEIESLQTPNSAL